MKVCLEVLASACIKRKKPWPRIVWLGKEKESLFLLGDNRVSVLYVPSGKTKRHVQKLSSVLPHTVFLTPTSDGVYLVGVQSSGEVFVWNKDRDDLKTIVGLASLIVDGDVTPKDGCQAFPAPDLSHLLLILGGSYVFLWQREVHANDSKNNTLLGKWVRIRSSNSIQMPPMGCKEISMHAVFTYTEVFGDCCQLSVVFNQEQNMCVLSLLIQFRPYLTSSQQPTMTPPGTSWSQFCKSLSSVQPHWEPINLKGAYTCQYSHDGQVLAVGINQRSPTHTNVVFLSALSKSMLVSDLKGCGLRDPGKKRGRQYWISGMAWTSDSLFLAVILHNGAAGLLSRLGDPVIVFSKGSSVELGPAYFLTFSPLITVQSDRKPDMDARDQNLSTTSETDPFCQRFSVTSHPSLPIVLFSDGYIVTIAQLPSELNAMIFMRDLVLESSSYLKQIAETHHLDLTLADAYNLPLGELEGVKIPIHKHNRPETNGHRHYLFEEPSNSLNETLDSDVSFALGTQESGRTHNVGAIQNMSSGKILFGEDESLGLGNSFLDEPDSTLKTLQLAQGNLFSVWKIAASSTETWSVNMDKIMNHAVHNIIKLLSLILDCQQIKDLLDDATDQFVRSPVVRTTNLFKVVSLYRQLMDLLQFDCLQRHLLSHVFQLSYKTLQTILSSGGLCKTDPRIKTLTGCLTLLQFTEKNLQEVYVSLPRTLQATAENTKAGIDDQERLLLGGAEAFQDRAELGKRLTSSWKLLYKSITQFIDSDDLATMDIGRAQAVKSVIEQRLIELGVDIPTAPVANINSGDKLSLDGKHTLAVDAWKDQLKQYRENGSVENASQLFHSLLYTYILRNDFVTAVTFVDDLIVKANPKLVSDLELHQKMSSSDLKSSVLSVVASTLKTQAMHNADMMPCIRDKTIRQVVQSMARFMAAYFSNSMIFVFPPHNPSPLPAVHFETFNSNSRVIPKYHEDIATTIRHQKLGAIWTVDRTLEYLLLSGLVCEAVWFADKIGDWKAAYQLSVAHSLHRLVAPSVYERPKRPLTLPERLTAEALIKRQLEALVKDDVKLTQETSDLTQLTVTLRAVTLSGILGSCEVGPWLLEQLVAKLKSVVREFSPLVAKDFYLPAPPLFLPQPAAGEQKQHSQEALEETKQREKASSIIRLALCVMNAANLSVASVQWYASALKEAQRKATKFKFNIEGPCADLPDVLYQFMEMDSGQGLFPDQPDDPSVLMVLSSFRDLCSVVWLLHARDKLSLALRSREKYLNLGLDVENSELWLQECSVTLQWALHLITFSRFLADEASVYKVVLSLLSDFSSTEDVADVLAECIYDFDNLHPEVQERLDRLLDTWQRVILVPDGDRRPSGHAGNSGHTLPVFHTASPRGMSLSVYYHKQCLIVGKILRKKKHCFGSYEEFVFTETNEEAKNFTAKLNVGSRPFETKMMYLEFLDTFVSISFSQVLESVSDKSEISSLPMLQMFYKDIVDKEMMNFVERKSGSAHQKQQGLSVLSGASQALARTSSQERVESTMTKHPEHVWPVPGRGYGREMINVTGRKQQRGQSGSPGGLFRGMSMVDSPAERSHVPVRRYESEPMLDDLNTSDESEAQPSPAVRQHKQSLTDFTSNFWQAEQSISPGHGKRDQGKPAWSLTVSFGKKYVIMQQIVEWLEQWGGRSHSLGFLGQEKILDITPKIKIHIPPQLIVLSLWLLEHKYSPSGIEKHASEVFPHSGRLARGNQSSLKSQSSGTFKSKLTESRSKTNRKHKSGRLLNQEAVPDVPATDIGDQSMKLEEKITSHKAQGLERSLPPPTLEQDQIIYAYSHLLDEHEDSSSINVSSLASEELEGDLKTTLNAIRRTASDSNLKENSALNRTLLPSDDTVQGKSLKRPQQKDLGTLVKEDHIHARQITTSLTNLSTTQRNSHSQTDQNTNHPTTEQPGQERNDDLREGIVSQVQGVIRDELRRIMEAQHRGVLAMMGALGEKSPSDLAPISAQRTASVTQVQPQQKANLGKQSKGHVQTQTSSSEGGRGRQAERENEEEDEAGESVSMEKTHAPFLLGNAQRRQDFRGGNHMREALAELQNLQQTTKQQQPRKDHVRANNQNILFSYPGSQAENNVRLPSLPFHAWTEPSRKQPQPYFPDLGVPRLPLLHINKSLGPEDAFTNLRRFLPQVPPLHIHIPQMPPQIYHTQPTQLFFPPPPPPQPSTQLLFSYPTPTPHPHKLPPPTHDQPLPLLTVAGGEKSFSGLPLLKFLSSGSPWVSSEAVLDQVRQKEKVEETRQKLLRKFHEQVLQDKENAGQRVLAHQMLQLDIPDEPQSARSEASRASLRGHADSKVESQAAEGQGRPTPRQEQSGVEVADAATSDTHVDDGFVLPRGIFDNYLQLGEQLVGPEVNETNAAFQLKLAQAMQRQLEKKLKSKVDFSTMTQEQVDAFMATDPAMEVVRTAEAATSITKDTGVDPVQEVVNEYNAKRRNNFIPPDIFMGLRFGDQDAQSGIEPPTPSSTPGKGRSYLNVVDIRASSVLRDIPERAEVPEPLLDQDRLDAAILSSERTVQQMGVLEETLRQKFAPRPTRAPGHGYDAVTVQLFDQAGPSRNDLLSDGLISYHRKKLKMIDESEIVSLPYVPLLAPKEQTNSVSVAVVPRKSVSPPKASVIRHLKDMSDQLKVIDEMSQNIERDFQSSHLLLRTIKDINESTQRSRSASPVRPRTHKSRKESRHSVDDEDENKTSRQSSPGLPVLKTSARSPQASVRSKSTLGSQSGGRMIEPENELSKLIAEVLVQEGVDLQVAGFSQEMTEQLERDARKQIHKSSVLASSGLKDKLVNMRQADEHVKSRTAEERERLKVWMTQKFHQRQEEYMRRRNELIQREPKPFRSQTMVTKVDLKNLEEKNEKRILMTSEFMNQRLLDAERLLGSIIVDKPEIPWASISSFDTKRRNQSKSPGRPGSSTSPPRLGASRRSRSPGRRKVNEAAWVYKMAAPSRSPYGTDVSKVSKDTVSVKGILKSKDPRASSTDLPLDHHVLTSISEGDRTLGSSTELMDYARQVLENDGSDVLSPLASFDNVPEMGQAPPQDAIQGKKATQGAGQAHTPRGRSFADLVRVQRPEATRKWSAINQQRRMLGESKKLAAQNPNMLKDKAKEYGSKHIPGFSQRHTGPRRVKTYSERLQEMKPTKPYVSSVRGRLSSARTTSTTTFQSSARNGPLHKPQTYVEQLQKLRSKAPPAARPATSKTPLLMRTFLKAHGPKHRPKTYAEQLQELNPHPHKQDVHHSGAMQATVTLQGPARAKTRARPYSDPYSEVDYEELASVLSDWDVDENVRDIIYRGSSPSGSLISPDLEMNLSRGDRPHLAPSQGHLDYFETVMGAGDSYRLNAAGDDLGFDDYRSSVDIHEIERIAEMASVGSDSILSVIDWDAVESLIKDV